MADTVVELRAESEALFDELSKAIAEQSPFPPQASSLCT